MADVIYVRAEPDLKRRLRLDAARHDRPMADHVRALLDEQLPHIEDEPAQATG